MDLISLVNNFSIADEEQEKIIEQQETAQRQERLLQYYQNDSGVNKRYWNESLDTFKAETEEEKKNLAYVRAFCEKKTRPMLFLVGKFGTGKTHLGCGIVRETRGTFISSFELCLRYEMGSDYKSELNRLEVLNTYNKKNVLVIDEIGRGKNDVEKLILPYIINERYERMLQTVLITNLEKDKVMELLGEATIDRLKEVCSTLTFNGKSKRGVKNEKEAC